MLRVIGVIGRFIPRKFSSYTQKLYIHPNLYVQSILIALDYKESYPCFRALSIRTKSSSRPATVILSNPITSYEIIVRFTYGGLKQPGQPGTTRGQRNVLPNTAS